MGKIIVDAKPDAKGNIGDVLFRGNQKYTPRETAIKMADRREIDNAHAVHPSGRKPYLRSNPDGKKKNNLDELAKD